MPLRSLQDERARQRRIHGVQHRRTTQPVRREVRGPGRTEEAVPAEGVYVTGGSGSIHAGCNLGLLSNVDCYVPANDVWIMRAPLICPDRWGHGAVAVEWGENETALHAIGGGIGNNTHLWDCDRYVVDNWSARANMPPPKRYKAAAFTYQTRYAIYAGGRTYEQYPSPNWPPLGDVDQYDPADDTWRGLSSLPDPRGDPASFSLGGNGYVCGGDETTQPMWTTYMYNGSWVLRTSAPSPARAEHRGFSIEASGDRPEYGYIVGGRFGAQDDKIRDLDRYDAVTDSWTAMPSVPNTANAGARANHTAAGLGDAGYMQGGEIDEGGGSDLCYGFNETLGWFATAPLPSPQRYLAAAAGM
jgi:hypothetical protein